MYNEEIIKFCANMINEFSLVFYNNIKNYSKDESQKLLNLWVGTLKAYPIKKLEKAKQYVLRTNTRMPVPADLINAIKVIKDSEYYKK